MKIKIAIRNIFRNPRRTFLNIIMITGGIAAIVVFRGFCHHFITKLQDVAINSQYGHVQIANSKSWNPSVEDNIRDRILNLPDPQLAKIRSLPEVLYASGRLSFFGLLSAGEHSLSARGSAFDPRVETKLQSSIRVVNGLPLETGGTYKILLGTGLQKQLGVKVGTSVTLLAYTYDGSINAIDVEVAGVFETELAEVDNTTFLLPLETAQKLLDTDSFENLIVQLHNTEQIEDFRTRLNEILPEGITSKPWSELATLYRQSVGYFDVQNMIIEWILMLLVLLSIVNTVGMSVSERTGEIGTARALGDTRADIVGQFIYEGLILGLIGGFVGCGVAYLTAGLVSSLKIELITPGSSVLQIIHIDLLFSAFRDAFILTCLVATGASLVPAIRASRMKIVDALKHNV
jgi:putative ABC transport system permease protein